MAEVVLVHDDELFCEIVEPSYLIFTCSMSTIEALEKRCKICSKLICSKYISRSGVCIVNFEHILHLLLVFLLLPLNK